MSPEQREAVWIMVKYSVIYVSAILACAWVIYVNITQEDER